MAELHWDLGGLAYEMAVRDHFRNDVLMSRAALLQERDAELAEVERKLGHERALGVGPGSEEARKTWARVLPPAQISALLLVAFLGFGVAMGAVAKGSNARRPRPREVLVAQAPAAGADGDECGEILAAGRRSRSDAERLLRTGILGAHGPSSAGKAKTRTKTSSGSSGSSSGGGEGSSGGGGKGPLRRNCRPSSTCSW